MDGAKEHRRYKADRIMSCLDLQENGSRTLSTDVQFPVTGISMYRCSPTTPIFPIYIQWTEKEKQVKRYVSFARSSVFLNASQWMAQNNK